MKRVFLGVLFFGSALSLGIGILCGPRAAVSGAVGAALALLNLAAFVLLVRKWTGPEGAGWAALGSLKLLGLLVIMTLLLTSGKVVHLALIGGYLALPLGIVTGGLFPNEGKS